MRITSNTGTPTKSPYMTKLQFSAKPTQNDLMSLCTMPFLDFLPLGQNMMVLVLRGAMFLLYNIFPLVFSQQIEK